MTQTVVSAGFLEAFSPRGPLPGAPLGGGVRVPAEKLKRLR